MATGVAGSPKSANGLNRPFLAVFGHTFTLADLERTTGTRVTLARAGCGGHLSISSLRDFPVTSLSVVRKIKTNRDVTFRRGSRALSRYGPPVRA